MEIFLTNKDPCNADYLDARTLAPLFRVTSLSYKRSSLGVETTVIQAFQSATLEQQQQQVPAHANVYTQSDVHGGYAASPYGASPTSTPALGVFAMPQPHQNQYQSFQPVTQGLAQPATTCQIEWHSFRDTQFHWTDSRGKVSEYKVVNSSGFFEQKRKFTSYAGRTYVWSEDGSLKSESKAKLGSIITSTEDLQTRWDAQPSSALRWGAILSLEQSVPCEDIGDIIAVLAYDVRMTRKHEERDERNEKLAGAIKDAAES